MFGITLKMMKNRKDMKSTTENLEFFYFFARKKWFTEVFKNLARCRSENNFVWTTKIIM